MYANIVIIVGIFVIGFYLGYKWRYWVEYAKMCEAQEKLYYEGDD